MRRFKSKEENDVREDGSKYIKKSVAEFFELVESGQKVFEGYWIEGQEESSYHKVEEIKEKEFKHLTFIDCMLSGLLIKNCTVSNCSFIDCEFNECHLQGNRVSDTYSDRVLIDSFSSVKFNTFDNVKGNMDHANGFNTFNCNNVFKNMSLDGFTKGIFSQDAFPGGALRWTTNFYYNTTVSLDELSTLVEDVRYIWNGKNFWDVSEHRNIIDDELDNDLGKKLDLDVKEWFGADNFIIDIQKMSKNAKINLVACMLTKLCKSSALYAYKKRHLLPNSNFDFHTEPNPLPIKIVSSNGNVIDACKIPDINIKGPYWRNFDYMNSFIHISFDGRNLEYLFMDSNDITKPENHICKQLVLKSDND